MKMLGDVSSMVSLLAAAAAAASSTASSKQANSSSMPPMNSMNFQFNPAQMQLSSPTSISQEFNSINTPSAAMAALYKYNSLYSNMQQQQQQQQQNHLQQSYLAKYMSLCYNKPVDYIQRLFSEQSQSNKDANLNFLLDSEKYTGNLNCSLQGSNQQKSINLAHRYHPYKSASTKMPITIITNGEKSEFPIHSPQSTLSSETGGAHLKKLPLLNRQLVASRTPSPASSLQESPIQKCSPKEAIGSIGRTQNGEKLNSPNLKMK